MREIIFTLKRDELWVIEFVQLIEINGKLVLLFVVVVVNGVSKESSRKFNFFVPIIVLHYTRIKWIKEGARHAKFNKILLFTEPHKKKIRKWEKKKISFNFLKWTCKEESLKILLVFLSRVIQQHAYTTVGLLGKEWKDLFTEYQRGRMHFPFIPTFESSSIITGLSHLLPSLSPLPFPILCMCVGVCMSRSNLM